MIDLSFAVGILGMFLILFGFFMTQSHRWSQDDLSYDVVNLIGSCLLIVYGVAGNAWPFVILNAVWALYSLKDVVQDTQKNRRKPHIRP